MSTDDLSTAEPPEAGLRWWREVAYLGVFYAVYSFVRNQFGSGFVAPQTALDNAEIVIAFERGLGLFHEETMQEWILHSEALIVFWNGFYGSAHFVVTLGVLIFTYRRFPNQWRQARTSLALMTALALIGFATFPLMPPRLLPASWGFVDTLAEYGSPWSFESGPMNRVSNQYAAMPSLHFGWAAWVTVVLRNQLTDRRALTAAFLYPWVTLFCIIVTANHYWLDAVGGAIAMVLGWYWCRPLVRRYEARRHPRPSDEHGDLVEKADME